MPDAGRVPLGAAAGRAAGVAGVVVVVLGVVGAGLLVFAGALGVEEGVVVVAGVVPAGVVVAGVVVGVAGAVAVESNDGRGLAATPLMNCGRVASELLLRYL